MLLAVSLQYWPILFMVNGGKGFCKTTFDQTKPDHLKIKIKKKIKPRDMVNTKH